MPGIVDVFFADYAFHEILCLPYLAVDRRAAHSAPDSTLGFMFVGVSS
jgi:hypothetical protein